MSGDSGRWDDRLDPEPRYQPTYADDPAYPPTIAYPPGVYPPGAAYPPAAAYPPGAAYPPAAPYPPGAAYPPGAWYPDAIDGPPAVRGRLVTPSRVLLTTAIVVSMAIVAYGLFIDRSGRTVIIGIVGLGMLGVSLILTAVASLRGGIAASRHGSLAWSALIAIFGGLCALGAAGSLASALILFQLYAH